MLSLLSLLLVLPAVLAAPAGCPPSSTTTAPGGGPTPGVNIHPNGNNAKCLDVRGGVFADGTPVQIYDCNGSAAQKWNMYRGQTAVQVQGTNYCLDIGLSPSSGTAMKIWTCYNLSPQQTWTYTNDNRVTIKGYCLDLSYGSTTNSNPIQIWQCGSGNNNQVWTT